MADVRFFQAKRSRDMRKNREDQVTLRANYLEVNCDFMSVERFV